MSEPKRAVKDSLFTFLFSQPEYTRQLYLTLHPEDQDVTEADCKLVTIQNILINGQYNDLGFQVRDRLILLMEAQSTFSENIPLRMFLYLAATYKDYVDEHDLYLYAPRAVPVPRPELYVVYTGRRADVPDTLRLSQVFGGAGDLEATVHVLRGDGSMSILDQYVCACTIIDEQVRIHGRTEEALVSALRICRERGILAPFLASRHKEVVSIMTTLFDEERLRELDRQYERQEWLQRGMQQGIQQGMQQGIQQGIQQGMQQGMQQGQANVLRALLSQFPLYQVSAMTHIPIEEIKRLTGQ